MDELYKSFKTLQQESDVTLWIQPWITSQKIKEINPKNWIFP